MKPRKAFYELKDCQKRRRLEVILALENQDEIACTEYSEPNVENVSGCQDNIDSDSSPSSRMSGTQCDPNSIPYVMSNTSMSDNSSDDVELDCVISCPTRAKKCENLCSLKLKRCLQEFANDESIPNDCINRLLQKLQKDFPELPKTTKGLKKRENFEIIQMSPKEKCCSIHSSRNENTSSAVMDLLHRMATKLDQIDQLQSGIKRISDQQEALERLLTKKMKKVEYRSANIEQRLEHPEISQPLISQPLISQPVCKEESLPGPAKTLDELDALLQQPGLPRVLGNLVRVSVSESMRRILKRLLARDLAMQFSFSGLGHRRQQSKIAFKDHSAMSVIYGVLAAGGFYDQKEIAVATQRGLRGAVDWDGYRPHRRTSAAEAAEMIAVETMLTESIPGPSMSSETGAASSAHFVFGDTDMAK